MIIVKPSSDILQLNKGFGFKRNGNAFDDTGELYFPHNARFGQGKFGKALFVEEGTSNLVAGIKLASHPNIVIYHTPYEYTAKRIVVGNCLMLYELGKLPLGTVIAGSVVVVDKNMHSINPKIFLRNGSVEVQLETSLGYKKNTITITKDAINYFYVPHMGRGASEADLGDWVRLKNVQIEIKGYSTTFTPSIRSPEIVTIPITTLTPEQGQIDHYAYINKMAKRQIEGQTPTLFHIPREDGGMGIRVCHAEDSAEWVLQTQNDENDVTEVKALDSLTPDGWHRFTVKWTETEAKVLIDGIVAGTIQSPAIPDAFASEAYIGSYDGQENFLNTLHDDIRVSNIARADADDLTDYQADQPLPTDSSTIHKQSFDSPNNAYVRQGLVL